MSEEQPHFKVTDRRPFNPDGSPRDVEREEAPPLTSPPSPIAAPGTVDRPAGGGARAQSQPSAPPSGEGARPDEYDDDAELPGEDDPASFLNFIMSLASNAAAALGMMEHPSTGKRTVDLPFAKHWIDVLGMLEQKTQGNLDPREAQVLMGLLSDLRMQYVSLSKSAARASSPRGFTGRDITGG